ncbi:MAG: DNA-3-methyladenine glycosylase I [Nitrososphaerales archaeon]|nr:DNA-3-methyladenine glycosylase I [Nitrososphaerales archaeon]
MSKSVFTAGLNWGMVEKKWPSFRKVFRDFALAKVSKLKERDVKRLMKDASIVRNERKIRATISNAGQFLALGNEFGSFNRYLASFGKDEKGCSQTCRRGSSTSGRLRLGCSYGQ